MHSYPHTPWTERVFHFDFPLTHFPFILTRLYGSIARAHALTQACTEASLRHKPGDKWSIQEHIGHLIDIEALHEQRLREFSERQPMLSAADMRNTRTHAANHNARDCSDIIAEFERRRLQFIAHLRRFTFEELDITAMHPRLLQPMRVIDLACFVAEHDDHHFAVMEGLAARQAEA